MLVVIGASAVKIPLYVTPEKAEKQGLAARVMRRLENLSNTLSGKLAQRGMPAAMLGFRYRRRIEPDEAASHMRVIHEPTRHRARFCGGMANIDALPADRGWWGFSFRDVLDRKTAPTKIVTLRDAKVLAALAMPGKAYSPAVLDASGNSVELREIRYRPFHASIARQEPDLHLDDALWVAERVFDNYSHWFSAHLPKLVMLRDTGELSNLVLPAKRPAWVDASLRRIGIGPGDFAELPTPGVLHARRLRIVESDRFRPELLSAARAALAGNEPRGERRIFISRRDAKGRALLEEAEIEPLLVAKGFELVAMERLTLDEQIALMTSARILFAPHGAGLTNMLFCPPGTQIWEIADPAYPNPNFFAMAAALGHEYHYIKGLGVGDRHPLRQDLSVRVEDVRAMLDKLA